MPRRPLPDYMISPEEVGDRLQMDPRNVRENIRDKIFPFGVAWDTPGGTLVCKIPREQFEKWMSGELLIFQNIQKVG